MAATLNGTVGTLLKARPDDFLRRYAIGAAGLRRTYGDLSGRLLFRRIVSGRPELRGYFRRDGDPGVDLATLA